MFYLNEVSSSGFCETHRASIRIVWTVYLVGPQKKDVHEKNQLDRRTSIGYQRLDFRLQNGRADSANSFLSVLKKGQEFHNNAIRQRLRQQTRMKLKPLTIEVSMTW